MDTLSLFFSYTFNVPVWNVRIDDPEGLLLVELRDAVARQVHFAVMDLNQPRPAKIDWPDWPFAKGAQSWWMGVTSLHKGVVLLHRYTDAQRPESRGIWAIDARSGKLLWEHPEWNFLKSGSGALLVYRMDEDQLPVYATVDLVTGHLQPNTTVPLPDTGSEAESGESLVHPVHYPDTSPYFARLAAYLEQKLGVRPVKGIDYAESGRWIIVSYYICAEGGLQNRLLVLDATGRVHLQEILTEPTEGVGMSTFLIRLNHLIFVREKKILEAYQLDLK